MTSTLTKSKWTLWPWSRALEELFNDEGYEVVFATAPIFNSGHKHFEGETGDLDDLEPSVSRKMSAASDSSVGVTVLAEVRRHSNLPSLHLFKERVRTLEVLGAHVQRPGPCISRR